MFAVKPLFFKSILLSSVLYTTSVYAEDFFLEQKASALQHFNICLKQKECGISIKMTDLPLKSNSAIFDSNDIKEDITLSPSEVATAKHFFSYNVSGRKHSVLLYVKNPNIKGKDYVAYRQEIIDNITTCLEQGVCKTVVMKRQKKRTIKLDPNQVRVSFSNFNKLSSIQCIIFY